MGHERLNCFLINDRSFEAELDFRSENSPALPPSLLPNSLSLYQPFLVSLCHMRPGWQRAKPSWLSERFFQNIRALGPTSWLNALRLQFQDKKTCFYKLSDQLCCPSPPLSLVDGHICAAGTLGEGTPYCVYKVWFLKEAKV